MKKYFLAVCSFVALHLSAQDINVPVTKDIKKAMDRIDTNTIRSHIAYLADDKLKGRLPGTEGYQTAVDYVVDQFKKIGVTPAGDTGGFTQKLIIRKSIVNNSSAVAVLKDKNGNTDSLTFVKDFIPSPHPMNTNSSAEGQLVFVGYGIEIPGGYSDYKGVDVKGKIIIVVSGGPDGLHSTTSAHYSNAGTKATIAFEKGALGVISVNPMARPSTNMNPAIQNNITVNPEKTTAFGRGFTGNMKIVLSGTPALLKRFFMNSGKNMEQVLADMKKGKPSSFELGYSLSASYTTTHNDFESYNVVGLIPGTDKTLKSEYVVHTAHLDHVGIGRPQNGDSIYNGAHDNASGVASLIEIARVYKTSGVKPKRSVLIVMVAGEEMGLLGSSYFAANPTVPKASIVADVNTDMPTIIAPLLSVVPLGAEHSSLMNNVKFAAGYLGLDVEKDPEPTENRFVRSDQYSFVMNGIPALHIKYGNKSDVPGFNLVDFVKQWRAKYYHQAADGLENGIFNFTAGKTYVKLNFLISYSVAMNTERPKWNDGDIFALTTSK